MSKLHHREEWLSEGVLLLKKELFAPRKYAPPADIKVSCGFPSKGAFGTRRQVLGQCWYPQSGKHHQIFINPVEAKPLIVLGVLVHEVVHTITGAKAGHKTPFRKVAVGVGLEGKMTATVPGAELERLLEKIGKRLGPYPHEPLTKMTTGRPKEGTRLLKAACDSCGYTVRITRKWIDEVGLPACPACGVDLEEN